MFPISYRKFYLKAIVRLSPVISTNISSKQSGSELIFLYIINSKIGQNITIKNMN